MSEYITLSSEDSKSYFPDNKMTNFRVKLAKRLEISTNWEVAIVRFSFTNSLCNYNKPERIYIKDYETKKTLLTLYLAPQRLRDVEHLISIINSMLVKEVNISTASGDHFPTLELDEDDERVRLVHGMIGGRKVTLGFSQGLTLLFGLEREGFHYMNAFKTDLYLYADCVEQRVVGDVYAPLLAIVDIGNRDMEPGEQVVIKIKPPEYVRVSHSQIDEIEVQLLDDTGSEPKFDYGTVSLTLHFRKT